MKNRIFWALNHKSLIKTECSLLEKLGYEVYVPKIIGNVRSSFVSFDYDKNLTISESDLSTLNSFDFYSNKPNAEIADIINKNFDAIFCPSITPLLYNLLSIFKKHFFLRAFGYEANINYENVLKSLSDLNLINSRFAKLYYKVRKVPFLLDQVKKLGDKFHLAVSYEKIVDNETEYFQKHSVYLPIEISSEVWSLEDRYTGATNKIMFVCPSIENPYYQQIYVTFKDNFADVPHAIFGKQSKDCNDPNIVGFLEDSLYYKAMIEYKVMFYHSREKRHLHFHPLEAIVIGVPLVYMEEGELGELGGKNQPGACKSITEAKEKIKRILSNDLGLINDIKINQKRILNNFRSDYVEQIWRKNFICEGIK